MCASKDSQEGQGWKEAGGNEVPTHDRRRRPAVSCDRRGLTGQSTVPPRHRQSEVVCPLLLSHHLSIGFYQLTISVSSVKTLL